MQLGFLGSCFDSGSAHRIPTCISGLQLAPFKLQVVVTQAAASVTFFSFLYATPFEIK